MLLLNHLTRNSATNSLLNFCKFCSTSPCPSSTKTPCSIDDSAPKQTKTTSPSTPKYVSYARLMRADKPIGSWLLYWPCTWSIALSVPAGCLPSAHLLALFGAGAFLMRSAGCVMNDLWDRDFDKRVERTKWRPLAAGEVSEKEAIALLTGLLSASLIVLLQFNWLSVIIGSSSVFLVCVYPLAKRYTNWAQLVLGATFNWGAFLGYTAATGHFSPEVCLPLYLACICWTVVYDTIYAHQDKRDDQLLGLGSTALRFGDHTRAWLSAFSTGMLANLAFVGFVTDQLWPFYTALLASATHLAWQVGTVRTDDSDDCWTKFQSNQWLGAAIFTGILLSNVLKSAKLEKEEEADEQKDELGQFMERMEQRNLNVNFYT